MQENKLSVIKGSVLAILFTLVSVLIFALIIKIFLFDSNVIKAINQFIKCISIFVACLISVKEEKGLIKGLLIGLISSAFINVIFCVLNKGFSLSLWVDILFGTAIGAISGIICVNVKGK